MIIFSINFGHDASLAIIEDGNVVDFREIERSSRLKHHYGILSSTINEYLQETGMDLGRIDIIALSSTQQSALAHSADISLEFGPSAEHQHFMDVSPFVTLWDLKNYRFYEKNIARYNDHIELQGLIKTPAPIRHNHTNLIPSNISQAYKSDKYLTAALKIQKGPDLKKIQSMFFIPCTLSLLGIKKPAFYVDHHYCHANYALLYAKEEKSLSVTHDGGVPIYPFNSGGVYINSKKNGVFPLLSHAMNLGRVYDNIAGQFGIDAGKLMGLASYSNPNEHVLNLINEYIVRTRRGDTPDAAAVTYKILGSSIEDRNIRYKAVDKYEFQFPDVDLAIQAASNTQKFVETAYIELVDPIVNKTNEIEKGLNNIYLTGGFALNCPTNTKLNQIFGDKQYTALPGVGDTGLAIGAAIAVWYLCDDAKLDTLVDHSPAFPPSTLDHQIGCDDHSGLELLNEAHIPNFAAHQLVKGKIICIHQGRSEVGPRALGHRSVIAWAGDGTVRDRINQSKGRENWRPLAPLCAPQDFSTFFEGNIDHSKFMLSVSKVKAPELLPAITHTDTTARVQVLPSSETLLLDIIEQLRPLGATPVLVNTSFNRAGEPIVETFSHAKASFIKMDFDYLISDNKIFQKSKQ